MLNFNGYKCNQTYSVNSYIKKWILLWRIFRYNFKLNFKKVTSYRNLALFFAPKVWLFCVKLVIATLFLLVFHNFDRRKHFFADARSCN
jgi:hypothetical protein